VTFDIVPWREIAGAFLADSDFGDARLIQIVADLGDSEVINSHTQLFRQADVLFIDGPKDGLFETQLLAHLSRIGLRTGTLLVLDLYSMTFDNGTCLGPGGGSFSPN